jgi:hypothetical protein
MILPNVKYILTFLIFFNNIKHTCINNHCIVVAVDRCGMGNLFSLEIVDLVLSCSSQALYLIQSFAAGLPGLDDIWYSLKSWLAL